MELSIIGSRTTLQPKAESDLHFGDFWEDADQIPSKGKTVKALFVILLALKFRCALIS